MSYMLPHFEGLVAYGLATNHTAASTISGAAIDTRGYTYATILVQFGDVTATAAETITVKAQRDDNSGFTSGTDMSGWTTGAVTVANAIDNTVRIIHGPINDVNMERYMRIQSINSGGSTACPLSATVILSNGPTSTASTTYGAVVTATGT